MQTARVVGAYGFFAILGAKLYRLGVPNRAVTRFVFWFCVVLILWLLVSLAAAFLIARYITTTFLKLEHEEGLRGPGGTPRKRWTV